MPSPAIAPPVLCVYNDQPHKERVERFKRISGGTVKCSVSAKKTRESTLQPDEPHFLLSAAKLIKILGNLL